ncbi:unnamed protein product, partial [Effrenium voratum]
VGMALRKWGGTGKVVYWRAWRWWLGAAADFVGGIFFMTCVSFFPAAVLLPVVAVVQMGTGYVMGVVLFGESTTRRGSLGLACALLGVAALGQQDLGLAKPAAVRDFFALWGRLTFLAVNGCLVTVLVVVGTLADRSMLFVLISGYLDGVQFLATRALATSLIEGQTLGCHFWAVLALKTTCIVLCLHTLQLALSENLSRVAAAYPLVASVMPCMLGAAFFGDTLPLSRGLGCAFLCTLLGVALLSERGACQEDSASAESP